MKKYFLDCGANRGQSTRRFLKTYKNSNEYEIHCFEPNEKLNIKSNNFSNNVIIHDVAVWTYDGKVDFYLSNKNKSSSLMTQKKTGRIDTKHPVVVSCINFGKWIKNNINKDDFIILKMDIEGSEYKVLKSMINDGSIRYIDELWVEWHWHKMTIINRKQHNIFVQKLLKIHDLIIKKWR